MINESFFMKWPLNLRTERVFLVYFKEVFFYRCNIEILNEGLEVLF